jgi:CRP/FNR family cyclic AMP-dependent transcriptional regulator
MSPDAQSGGPDSVRLLLETYLFRALTPAEVGPLAAQASRRRYRRGDVVFMVNDPADALYIAESGTLKECTYTADGEETIIELHRRRAVFGEPALFAPERTRVVNVVTVTEASVLVIGREPLVRFLLAQPQVMLQMLEGLAAQVRESVETVTMLGHARIRDRLALKLAELAETHGSAHPAGRRIDVELSQSALGALIAASRTNTNRALARLILEGAVSFDGRRYVVASPAALRASVGADPRLLYRRSRRPEAPPRPDR